MKKIINILRSKIKQKFKTSSEKVAYKKSMMNLRESSIEAIIENDVNFNQETVFWGNGRLKIESKVNIGYLYGGGYAGRLSELQPRTRDSEIIIGKNVFTNNGIFICAAKKIIIGKDTLIGSNVTIMDHNAHGIRPEKRRTSIGTPREVTIGENVWIGNNVHILPGTIIGNNSIVGAGSIVKGIFPENVIIQGNPATIIKEIK